MRTTEVSNAELSTINKYKNFGLRQGWLDVYLGCGFEGEFCLKAALDGTPISKDRFGLSLLGAGGLQLNLNERTGLYLEPQISWRLPSDSHMLKTYRSENPLMFSLTGGLRFSFGR